jgi:hypothetical protein
LNGRKEVTADDFEILNDVLWKEPRQQKQVRKLVAKVSNPLGEQICAISDAATEVSDLFNKGQIPAAEANSKLKDCVKKLTALGDPEKNSRLKSAIASAKASNLKIVNKLLGTE